MSGAALYCTRLLDFPERLQLLGKQYLNGTVPLSESAVEGALHPLVMADFVMVCLSSSGTLTGLCVFGLLSALDEKVVFPLF